MSTKNLLDNPRQRPAVFSDLTGKVSYDPRLDIAETLIFLHEVYDLMKVAVEPEVHPFAQRNAVTAVCYHMGWLPYEVSAAEQYVTQGLTVPAQTTG